MAKDSATAPQRGGVALLERALGYTLGSLHLVTPAAMPYPTPCREWDLRALLAHMNDSLLALHEAIGIGQVYLDEFDNDSCADPVATLRSRACRMLGAWTSDETPMVAIGGGELTTGVVTTAGALEIVVHGWDVARACGHDRPIPEALAEELLPLAPLLITEADRPARFGYPLTVPAQAGSADQLLAYLGRQPHPPLPG